MKTNAVGTHEKHFTKALLMNTYNIYFHGEIRKNIYLDVPLIWRYAYEILGGVRLNMNNFPC